MVYSYLLLCEERVVLPLRAKAEQAKLIRFLEITETLDEIDDPWLHRNMRVSENSPSGRVPILFLHNGSWPNDNMRALSQASPQITLPTSRHHPGVVGGQLESS